MVKRFDRGSRPAAKLERTFSSRVIRMFHALPPPRRRRRRHPFPLRFWLANAVAALAVLALLGSVIFWFAGRGPAAPAELKLKGPGYGVIYLESTDGRMVVGMDNDEPDLKLLSWRGRRG